jgi:hypothetical protein
VREVIQEKEVSKAIDDACKDYPRIYDAIAGLEWRLGHRPQDGVARTAPFYVFRQSGFPNLNIPDITVLYRYEGEAITILRIKIEKSQ